MRKRILFILNEPTYFLSHRLPIALAAQAAGYDIHIATGEPTPPLALLSLPFQYHALPLSRSGKNIFKEARALWAMVRLMRSLKPDLVHLVTIKPVLYGSFAARFTNTPAIAAVSGLGFLFINTSFKATLLRIVVLGLYRIAFLHKQLHVIFQNPDDQMKLIKHSKLPLARTSLIWGSGICLEEYAFKPEPKTDTKVVVMACRLLKDKGVIEYIQAAQLLQKEGVQARFLLAGAYDLANPSGLTEAALAAFIKEGVIEYLGHCQDIATLFTNAHLVVLPSYREGLPRVLSEAAAIGRAIVTTDVPGCRTAIIPDVTGLLVPVKSILPLASAIKSLLLDDSKRLAMGNAGRAFAEQQFDIRTIVSLHMQIYHSFLLAPTTSLV